MQQRGLDLGLPDLEAGGYLLNTLLEMRPTSYTPMGEAPLNWQELAAFGTATGCISEPWEYLALHDMSLAYMAARDAGKASLSLSPVEQLEAV